MRARVAALVLAASVGAAHAQTTEPVQLTDVSVEAREGMTTVRIRTTAPAKYQTEVMDGPFRVVLDLTDTLYRWKTPPQPVAVQPVSEIRGSQYRKGIARVVIVLTRKTAHTIEADAEGLRVVFGDRARVAAPSAAPAPAPAPARPAVYGIILFDEDAVAYMADPATKQVRSYRVGDRIGESVIEAIEERQVTLRTPTGPLTLRLDDPK